MVQINPKGSVTPKSAIGEQQGWTKVDPKAFARAVAIMAAADPTDRKAVREAINRANAEIGIVSGRSALATITDPDRAPGTK